MRIALISFHTSPLATLGGKDTGGMNVFVREIARELGRRGHHVDVFSRSSGAHALRIDPRLGANVRVIHVPAGPEAPVRKDDLFRWVPAFTEWMCQFAQAESGRSALDVDQPAVAAAPHSRPQGAGPDVPYMPYDVIHANYWLSGLVAENLRACWGTKFVMTYHTLAELKNQIAQTPADMESDLRLKSECHLSDTADRITANTTVEKQQLVRFYGAGSSRIRIVPPGVDLSVFHPIEQSYAKSAIGIPRQHRMILFAGRIERLKGIDTLFKAVAVLKQRRPTWDWSNFCVSIIGGDPSQEGQHQNAEMARLHELRTELGLTDLVTFLGARDQDALHFYYAAAEMLIMPSHYESFGMVALEAMACGTPVIAFNRGSVPEIIEHGVTGWIAEDEAEAVAAIRQVADLSRAEVRRRFERRFSAERMAEDYLALYRRLAARVRPALRVVR